jgi:hypothetical protein
MVKTIKQVREVFDIIGLSGMTDLMDGIIEDPEEDELIAEEIEEWIKNFKQDDLEATLIGIENPKSTMIQLFNISVSRWDIHNIALGEEYDIKKHTVVYTIILNHKIPETARTRLTDYALARFLSIQERDEAYRSLKNKLRFFGISIR